MLGAARAQEVCYRATDCLGDKACVETRCITPDEPLQSCDSEASCDGYRVVCQDGYCKKSVIYCENPAGYCHVDTSSWSCECEDGTGSGGSVDQDDNGEVPTDNLSPDAELWDSCQVMLVGKCGEEAPDLSEDCTGDQLDRCEAYFEKRDALREACDEATEGAEYINFAKCCRRLEEEDEEFLARFDCVNDLPLEECAELDDCSDEEGGAGDGSDGDADSDTDADADDEEGDESPGADVDPDDTKSDSASPQTDTGSGTGAGGCAVVFPAPDSRQHFFAIVLALLGL